MTLFRTGLLSGGMIAAMVSPAFAKIPSTGFDQCEIVITTEVVDDAGGSMVVASYQSAEDFLSGVYLADTELRLENEDGPIRGLICVRNDLVPTAADYSVLATGIPLTLSQSFDSADSDLLTIYFDGVAFTHRYNSDYPMSEEFETLLEETLSTFSKKDHGLTKNPQ